LLDQDMEKGDTLLTTSRKKGGGWKRETKSAVEETALFKSISQGQKD